MPLPAGPAVPPSRPARARASAAARSYPCAEPLRTPEAPAVPALPGAAPAGRAHAHPAPVGQPRAPPALPGAARRPDSFSRNGRRCGGRRPDRACGAFEKARGEPRLAQGERRVARLSQWGLRRAFDFKWPPRGCPCPAPPRPHRAGGSERDRPSLWGPRSQNPLGRPSLGSCSLN